MRNNGGWGLSEMLVLCVLLFCALLISFFLYHRAFEQITLEDTKPEPTFDREIGEEKIENVVDYHDMEERVEEASRQYVLKYYSRLPEKNRIYVSLNQLQEEEMIGILEDSKGTVCSGYAYFENEDGVVKYHPFIKCKNHYTTKGYQSEFDS